MKHIALFLFTLLIIPFAATAQERADLGDIEITKIRENIHLLVSPQGGNVVASTGEDGTFIIDDQLAGRGLIIEKALKTLSDKGIKFILNTHYHFDHTGGNEFFGKNEAVIVAHDNVHKRLSTDQFITFFKKDLPALDKEGLPVVTFSHDMSFHYNGHNIKITHVPKAHTDGDAVAHFTGANVIVAGDTIFNGMYPFIDVEHGGSVKGVIAALDALLELSDDDTIIVPGHGKQMNKVELQAYRQTLSTIAKRVETAIKDNKILEQIVATKPTAEFDAEMGDGIIGPDAFVTLLVEDLARK